MRVQVIMPTAASASQQEQESSLASFPLLSAPDSWLHSFLSSADADTKLALLQTCTELKNKLLHGQRVLLDVELDASSLQVKELQRQQVILQQAANVKLQAECVDSSDADRFLSYLLMRHMALLGGPLVSITAVNLKGCILPEVVPSCLVAACPNMKLLELKHCSVGGDLLGEQVPPLPVCLQLTELVLHPLSVDRMHALERAAHKLPNLVSLDLVHDDWEDSTVWGALLPYCGQLKQLRIYLSDVCNDVGLRLLRQCVHLTRLSIDTCTLDDSLMDVLLTLSSLRHLTVYDVEVDTCFQQRACSWELLHVSYDCTVASLARLPLHGIQKLELPSVIVREGDTQAIVADAINNMASSGPCQACHGGLCVVDRSGKQDLLCMAALPLLQHITGCQRLFFNHVEDITTGFIDLLAKNIGPGCESVEFYDCSWVENSWQALHPSLPGFVHCIKKSSFNSSQTDILR